MGIFFSVLAFIGALCGIYSFCVKKRNHFYIYNGLAVAFYIPLFVINNALSGVIVFLLIILGSILQACIQEEKVEEMRYARWAISFVGIVVGPPFVYNSPIDTLPALAFLFGRLGEAQSSKEKIFFMFLFCMLTWMSYYIFAGMWIPLLGTCLACIVNIMRNRKAFKELLFRFFVPFRPAFFHYVTRSRERVTRID